MESEELTPNSSMSIEGIFSMFADKIEILGVKFSYAGLPMNSSNVDRRT
jgi:hypothetical protein